MPDKLLKHGLCTSAKIGGVTEFAELLFIRLILATCHAGRCPWNPDWIRTHALPNRPRKRLAEIAAALDTLRRAHLVARYTAHDGTPYLLIPNHGQRLRHTVRSPWPAPPEGPPDIEGQTFMALPGQPPAASDPPAGIGKKPKASVSSVTHFTSLPSSSERGIPKGASHGSGRATGPGPGAPGIGSDDLRLAEDCLDELASRYPRHDVRACLRQARAYARKQRGEEAEVTLGWFVVYWMPKAPERKQRYLEAPTHVSPAQMAQQKAEAARFAAEQQVSIAALIAGPEPADKNSLDHAIWVEGRKGAAA